MTSEARDIVRRLRKATLYEGHGELSALPEEAADTIERLREALIEIRDRHIPDQPSALDIDEAEYICRQYAELRYIARQALDPHP